MNQMIYTLSIKRKLEELKKTISALAKEEPGKPTDQFLAEILVIKEQLNELSDLTNPPFKKYE